MRLVTTATARTTTSATTAVRARCGNGQVDDGDLRRRQQNNADAMTERV